MIGKFCDKVETVNGFCNVQDQLYASGGCEVAVTSRLRISCVRFKECKELLIRNRFPLKIKGKVCLCCARSAILYRSEAWCFKEEQREL